MSSRRHRTPLERRSRGRPSCSTAGATTSRSRRIGWPPPSRRGAPRCARKSIAAATTSERSPVAPSPVPRLMECSGHAGALLGAGSRQSTLSESDGRGRAPQSRRTARASAGRIRAPGRADHRDLRGHPGAVRPRRQSRDEGDAAVPAEVLRPVGVLPGQGHPRAPISGTEAPARGGPARARRVGPAGSAGAARGLDEAVRRRGEALQRGEEGHREGSEEARARARPLAGEGSLLPLRRGHSPNRHRDVLGLHPGALGGHLHVQPGAGGARNAAHRQRLLHVRPPAADAGRALTTFRLAAPAAGVIAALRLAASAAGLIAAFAFLPAASAAPAGGASPATQLVSIESGRVTIDARDAELTEVLSKLAELAGFQLTTRGELGRITATFTVPSVERALQRLAQDHELMLIYGRSGGGADPDLTEVAVFGPQPAAS